MTGTGQDFRARREALGFSIRGLADEFEQMGIEGVKRATIAKIEDDDPTVAELTRVRFASALSKLERRLGADAPDTIVQVVEVQLPNGQWAKVTHTGPAAGVAEAAARFLAEHGR